MALIDSAADECFIDPYIVQALSCLMKEFLDVKSHTDLDGRLLTEVEFVTCHLQLCSLGNHVELRKCFRHAVLRRSDLGDLCIIQMLIGVSCQ